jgi:ppGpp synthetase/RelA/SpoT-type nucleotidyltranferase
MPSRCWGRIVLVAFLTYKAGLRNRLQDFLADEIMNFIDYQKNAHALYKSFARVVEAKLKEEITKGEKLPRLQSTQSREKDPVSLKAKLENRGLLVSEQIDTEIKDLAGVRLIFYTNTDVDRFLNSQLITDIFDVDFAQTRVHHPNTENEQRPYQAIHYIISLSEQDVALPEYQCFRGLRCEIQIQTILNHAWAEIHHDMVYKARNSPGYGTAARDALDKRLKKVMDEYLRPAAYEIQKAQHDHERLMQGKLLFERGALEELKRCTNNNERHEMLASIAEYVIPNYDDHASVYPDIVEALQFAVNAARTTKTKVIPSPFGNLPGKSSKDVAVAVVGILDSLRFVDVEATFRSLIDLYTSEEDEEVRKSILRAVKRLAEYDLHIWNKAGLSVQLVLAEVMQGVPLPELRTLRQLLITAWRELLGADMEGAIFAWDRVDISIGAVPANQDVKDLRRKAMNGLIALFDSSSSVTSKKEVISALNGATRLPYHATYSNEFCQMVLENTLTIVQLLADRVSGQPYEVLQSIESDLHSSYVRARQIVDDEEFNSRHIAQDLRQAILVLRDSINADRLYVRFKTLVGVDSVFTPQWESDDFDYINVETYRLQQIELFVDELSNETVAEWFQLIRQCAATESNDTGAFTAFGKFLFQLSKEKPVLACALAELGDSRLMLSLPIILTGLSESESQGEYSRLVTRYLDECKHLAAIARHCRFASKPDANLVGSVLDRAVVVDDVRAVFECMAFAVKHHNPPEVSLVDPIFIPALNYLIRKQDPGWIDNLWYMPEGQDFFPQLSAEVTGSVLESLVPLNKIDTHSETILALVAKNYPARIWQFLMSRFDRRGDENGHNDPIPYRLHALKAELARDVQLAIGVLRQSYRAGDHKFRFTGGRLLHAVFPRFTDELAVSLIETVSNGSSNDYDFAIALLENYTGEIQTLAVVQELVDRLPDNDSRLKALDICLTQTGVLSGQFGRVEAYREKKKDLLPWLDDSRLKVREFAKAYVNKMDQSIAQEQRFAENDGELQRRR